MTGCLNTGFNLPGNDIQRIPNFASSEDCQKQCQSNDACKFFTYDAINKICWLKNAETIPTVVAGHVSGPKVCQNCFQDQTDFFSNDIEGIPNIRSTEDCQKRCQAHAACNFFTYDSRYQNCWLKNGAIPMPSSLGFVSGPKSCTTCFLPNLDVESSNDLVKNNNVKSTEDCQKLCQSNYDCRFFTYNSSSSTCVLKSAASKPFSSTASTLGPKYC